MRTFLLAAATLLLTAACDAAPPGQPAADAGPAPVPPSHPLRLELEAPATVREGEVLTLRLAARNAGDHALVLETGDSAYTFDFVVTDQGGAELWSRMHTVQAIPLVLRERTLPPGGEVAFVDRWDLRDNGGRAVPPGRYTVHALLDADTMPHRMLKAPPKTLVVTPR